MVAGQIATETTAQAIANDPEAQRRWLGRRAGRRELRRDRASSDRRPGGDAGHQGTRVRLPARPRARGGRRGDPGGRRSARRARAWSPTSRARRSPARRAPTTPQLARGGRPRRAPMDAMGRGAAAVLAAAARRGAPGRRGLGRADRATPPIAARGDARPADRRAQADRLHRGLGRHPPLRGGGRHHDDVLRRRHRRDQPDLRRGSSPTRPGRSPAWPGAALPAPATSARWSARRCSASPRRA